MATQAKSPCGAALSTTNSLTGFLWHHFTFIETALSYPRRSHALERALPWRKLLREGQSTVAIRGNTGEAWENRFYSVTVPERAGMPCLERVNGEGSAWSGDIGARASPARSG